MKKGDQRYVIGNQTDHNFKLGTLVTIVDGELNEVGEYECEGIDKDSGEEDLWWVHMDDLSVEFKPNDVKNSIETEARELWRMIYASSFDHMRGQPGESSYLSEADKAYNDYLRRFNGVIFKTTNGLSSWRLRMTK